MKPSKLLSFLPALALLGIAGSVVIAQNDAPPKALMITGGCCHDYANQQNIISEGVSERFPTDWTVHYDDDEAKMKEYLSQEGWADDYDVIVYNHCFAHEKDAAFVDSVAAIHAAGKPAVALHCAMHSFHWDLPEPEGGAEKTWPQLLGVHSRGHGPKAAITVSIADGQAEHPVIADMPDGWKTPEGELYNTQRILDSATVLAWGENGVAEEPQATIWVNDYQGTRVFCTTIGHHNSTMSTPEYLDLLANGVKWVLGSE